MTNKVVLSQSTKPSPVTPLRTAAAIMGVNFHGPGQVERAFRIRYTEEEMATLALTPFSNDVLHASTSTHMLVSGYPIGITALRAIVPILFEDQDWYVREAFANSPVPEVRWYLIRREPVPHSLDKSFDMQMHVLAMGEIVPTACVLAYCLILHLLATKERLMDSVYARCADVDSQGARVDLGRFRQEGLRIDSCWDTHHVGFLGLASCRL